MSVKHYEYISDGYSARFLNPRTGKPPRYGNYVELADYDIVYAENKILKSKIDIDMKVGVPYADYESLFSYTERMKAEVESIRQVARDNKTETEATRIENARLKDENKRLKGEEYAKSELGSLVPKHLLEYWINENARLKEELERVKKGFNRKTASDVRSHPLMGPAGAERGWWGIVPPPEDGKTTE